MKLPQYNTLQDYGQIRDALLARITDLLAADPRVGAAWLSGSFGRDEADAWADLDLHLAIFDEHLPAFLAGRQEIYQRIGRPLLVQQEMVADSMPASTFQLVYFPGPVEVDWIIGPVSRAVRSLAYRMLVERAQIPVAAPPALDAAQWRTHAERWLTFFWAMAPIAVKCTGRGETRRAANQITLLSRAYIAIWRLLHESQGPEPLLDWTNRVFEPELDAVMPQLGQHVEPLGALTVVETLCAAIEGFHPALVDRGVAIPVEMPPEVRRLAELARQVLRQDPPPMRKYR